MYGRFEPRWLRSGRWQVCTKAARSNRPDNARDRTRDRQQGYGRDAVGYRRGILDKPGLSGQSSRPLPWTMSTSSVRVGLAALPFLLPELVIQVELAFFTPGYSIS